MAGNLSFCIIRLAELSKYRVSYDRTVTVDNFVEIGDFSSKNDTDGIKRCG